MITMLSFLLFSVVSIHIIQALITGNINQLHSLLIILVAFIGVFLCIQVYREWTETRQTMTDTNRLKNRQHLFTMLALTGGTYLTFILNHTAGLGGVLASSLVGLLAAWKFKPYAAAIYCGSFIGMACSLIFSNPFSLLLASLIASILFVISLPFFAGYGGKLGFMAFTGTFSASLIMRTPLRTVDPLAQDLYLPVFIFIIIAGMVTYFLQRAFEMDAVSASALIGLTFALLYPDPAHTVVVAAFCATFTGMVSCSRCTSYKNMFFLTTLTAVLFIAAFALFDGSGGKLGAIAFIATVSGTGMLQLIRSVKKRISPAHKATYSTR